MQRKTSCASRSICDLQNNSIFFQIDHEEVNALNRNLRVLRWFLFEQNLGEFLKFQFTYLCNDKVKSPASSVSHWT